MQVWMLEDRCSRRWVLKHVATAAAVSASVGNLSLVICLEDHAFTESSFDEWLPSLSHMAFFHIRLAW